MEAIRNRTCELSLVQKIRRTPFGSRLLGDAVFRSEITLHGGLFINLLYVALNLFSGIRYRSAWFISIAFYYISLSIMRTVLVHYIHHNTVGQDIPAEYRRYRICGIILLMMDQALVGIVIYMITQNQGFSYPGLMIYAMAMYSFYITIVAIINVVRYRKRGSPLLSAAKVTSLTAALVSMLSLETAMLSQFGNGEQELRRIMLAISGGIVCILILTMSVYMIVRSTKQLKKLQNNNLKT